MSNHETDLNLRQSSTFMETLQDKLKDIKNFSNWSAKEQMVAVTAVGMIFGTLLPVVTVALPVAAAGAAVALTLFLAVKAVEYAFKGLRWSAEKTWEGAKCVGSKIKDDYEHSLDSLKRGAKNAADRFGGSLKEFAHSGEHPMESEFVQKLLEQKGMKRVVNMLTEIVKESGTAVKVEKLADEEQRELKKILTKSTLDAKEFQFIINIFSEHNDEIKRVIREYKFDQSVKRNNAKDKEERKASKFSLFSSLRRKSPKQSDNLSSHVTNSTDVLEKVVSPKVPGSPFLNSLESHDSGRDSLNSSGSSTPTKSPSVNLNPFGSIDSSSLPAPLIPEKLSLSMKDVEGGNPQAKLRKTDSPYKSEQPSTQMSVVDPQSTLVKSV
ncbi:hypothetical protein IHO40_01715 [Wolbachia endosymbiont of Mansonella ozzardi]|nr:hypothetical protein [Wolbachia endosymbiont of Mansonella ozzardi]